jgi:adenylosuccinate synthase
MMVGKRWGLFDAYVGPDRLIIDPDAVIITEEIKQRELQSGLIGRIGSTGSGTGAAVVARINREYPLLFAHNIKNIAPFIRSVPDILRECINNNERIIIEGTQGFGLSPFHSRYYPFTTSRDTTASSFLAETGLSPRDVDDIILTLRSFPIRVAGNSGPLPNEITWKSICEEEGGKREIIEKSSVTKNIRRVARFNPEIVRKAIKINNPTRIVLNHLDYLPKDMVFDFTEYVEKEIEREVEYFGFDQMNLIERNELRMRIQG